MSPIPVLSESLAEFLSPDELDAAHLMRERFHVDVTRTYQFWEAAVVRITDGVPTSHKCPWDVEIDPEGIAIRVEVKFSQEFRCRFQTGVREVMKFADPKGSATEKASHVTILVGIDAVDAVHTWAIPSALLPQSRSITLTSPRVRLDGHARSRVDSWRCPPTQLLPETLRAWRCHLHYDRDHHAQTAAQTRLAAEHAGMEPLPLDDEQGELF